MDLYDFFIYCLHHIHKTLCWIFNNKNSNLKFHELQCTTYTCMHQHLKNSWFKAYQNLLRVCSCNFFVYTTHSFTFINQTEALSLYLEFSRNHMDYKYKTHRLWVNGLYYIPSNVITIDTVDFTECDQMLWITTLWFSESISPLSETDEVVHNVFLYLINVEQLQDVYFKVIDKVGRVYNKISITVTWSEMLDQVLLTGTDH